jgi:hypothetical protein
MKYNVLLLFAITMMACNNEADVLNDLTDQPTKSISNIRSLDDAVDLAINAKTSFYPSVSRSDITVDKSKVIVLTKASKSRANADTTFYVVNFDDNEGFAIINAKKLGVDVYAVTEEGVYLPESKLCDTPPALDVYLNTIASNSSDETSYSDDTSNPDGLSSLPLMQLKIVEDTIFSTSINPMVKTRWCQSSFFGQFCPNGLVGCGPLALGQALAAFSLPTSMTFSFDNRPYDSTTFNWAELTAHNKSFTDSICTKDLQYNNSNHIKIAAFLREIGLKAKARYETIDQIQTTTYIDTLEMTAKSFSEINVLPSNGITSSFNCPIESNQKTIFICSSWEVDPNTYILKNGHAWIIDGCKIFKIRTRQYQKADNEAVWTLFDTSYSDEKKYCHINWGWNGSANGYFYIYDTTSLCPGDGKEYDYSSISNTSSYNYVRFSYFGIYK